jgi:hypothetical protein
MTSLEGPRSCTREGSFVRSPKPGPCIDRMHARPAPRNLGRQGQQPMTRSHFDPRITTISRIVKCQGPRTRGCGGWRVDRPERHECFGLSWSDEFDQVEHFSGPRAACVVASILPSHPKDRRSSGRGPSRNDRPDGVGETTCKRPSATWEISRSSDVSLYHL